MKDVVRNKLRRRQLSTELTNLRLATSDWLEFRRANDRDDKDRYVGRHETQLAAIALVLEEALEGLEEHLGNLQPQTDVEEFYGLCREYDEAIVWLRRLWEYFKDKFDQRDGPVLGPVLRSADEVVWSCWHEVFVQARRFDATLKQGPVPLSFIAAEYSPAAVQSDRPPASLMMAADLEFLEPFLRTLPVPLLRLPPWCVAAPWWLIYVAHEVGHHIQRELGLIRWFADAVASAVATVGKMQPADAEKWRRWGEEIFSDMFSVAILGPWAILGILEVELAPHRQMATRRREYPAPIIRLALMDRAAERLAKELGENWIRPLAGLDLASIALLESTAASRDWEAIDAVVAVALGPLRPPLGSLRELCKLESGVFAQETGKVSVMADLLRGEMLMAAQNLETARQLAAAALQAWQESTRTAAAVAGEEEGLARRVIATLQASAHPGTRAKLSSGGPVEGKGAALLTELLRRSRDDKLMDGTEER